MLPSAVSDSRVHNILPNKIETDFQFSRASAATRVNHQGLIENVGYFSDELVRNGDFSELGPELIVNGDFATDSDWSLGTGWSISNGKLRADNASLVNAFQAKIYTSGKTYKVTYTISDYVKGQVRFQLGGGGSTVNGETRGANGTYTEYVVATNNHTSARFRGLSTDGGFTASIDNVSVKQVDPNDRWEFFGESELTQQGARIYSSSGVYSAVNQNNVLIIGKQYKVTFDVISTNGANLANGGGTITYNTSTTGSKKFIITANETIFQLKRLSGATDVTVNNISVVEVQGDRPRLSYDITNGVVEKQPHLLLEPSRTNYVLLSNDFSYINGNGFVTSNYSTSREGLSASRVLFTGSNQLVGTSTSLPTGVVCNFSAFVKGVQGETIKFAAGGQDITHIFSGEWERLSGSTTSINNSWNLNTFGGATARDFELCGAQLEVGSYATSYIPTAGTTITRAAETCNNSKPSLNSTEGVLYTEIASLADDSEIDGISISDGTGTNRVVIFKWSASNTMRGRVTSGGTNTLNQNFTVPDITSFKKIAIKYKLNDFAIWLNGSEVFTDTSGAVPSGLNVLAFSSVGSGGADFYGKVKGLAVYNEALSESQLMQLTGVTASSIYNNFVTRTASYTVEALNEVKKVIDNL